MLGDLRSGMYMTVKTDRLTHRVHDLDSILEATQTFENQAKQKNLDDAWSYMVMAPMGTHPIIPTLRSKFSRPDERLRDARAKQRELAQLSKGLRLEKMRAKWA
jgi:hypothetical protein